MGPESSAPHEEPPYDTMAQDAANAGGQNRRWRDLFKSRSRPAAEDASEAIADAMPPRSSLHDYDGNPFSIELDDEEEDMFESFAAEMAKIRKLSGRKLRKGEFKPEPASPRVEADRVLRKLLDGKNKDVNPDILNTLESNQAAARRLIHIVLASRAEDPDITDWKIYIACRTNIESRDPSQEDLDVVALARLLTKKMPGEKYRRFIF